MTARNDDDRFDAGCDDGAEHDGTEYDGPEYGGVDALMAVLVGEPLPEAARRDVDFMAAHRSAAADVAVLREQLGLLGDALAQDGGGPSVRSVPAVPEPEPETGGGARVTSLSVRRTRRVPHGVALKGLVAAVGATVVIGMGWLVVQSGGVGAGSDQGASSAADSSAGRPQAGEEAMLSHAGYLACARIVVEGTVAAVEQVPGTGQDRVTLDATRYYKPAEGPAQVVFPREIDVEPRLRAGDHVLVGIQQGQAQPDLLTTGEKAIARDRAWILRELPTARVPSCE